VSEPVAKPSAHQVRVRVDAAWNCEQAAGGELVDTCHRAAEPGDPAAGDADVSSFCVTGRHHGGAAYNKVKDLRLIACHSQTLAWCYAEFPAA
jgi:hypothetical protein